MSTQTTDKNVSTDLTARARRHAPDADYLGRDGTDATHFWSIYHQRVIVFHDGSTHSIDVPARMTDGTRIDNLADWVDYIDRRHDWRELRISGGLVDDLRAALEAR